MLTLEGRIDIYSEFVEYIAVYDELSELVNEFVNREAITDALERGEVLTPELRTMLEEADAALKTALPTLAARSPTVFAARDTIPQKYWWWHVAAQK